MSHRNRYGFWIQKPKLQKLFIYIKLLRNPNPTLLSISSDFKTKDIIYFAKIKEKKVILQLLFNKIEQQKTITRNEYVIYI